MGIFSKLRAFLKRGRPKPLCWWFIVTFDEQTVHMHAAPPGETPWSQSFRWDDIIRICFKAEGMCFSDGIYVFTSTRPESYVIPTESCGGAELWSEIVRRKLFDTELAVEMLCSFEGLYCWPTSEQAQQEESPKQT